MSTTAVLLLKAISTSRSAYRRKPQPTAETGGTDAQYPRGEPRGSRTFNRGVLALIARLQTSSSMAQAAEISPAPTP